MVPDLVYDVGMNNGDDTAHYLAKGFRVVAVEANPALVEQAKQRFRDAVAAGRLTLVNAAVAAESGVKEFWISERSEWSSFDRGNAEKFGTKASPILVPCRRFDAILAEYAVPYYLKIDIEGSDEHCLSALDPGEAPAHVSVELSSLNDMLTLARLGYNAFKLVRQNDFSLLDFDELMGWRAWLNYRAARGAGERITLEVLRGIARPLTWLRSASQTTGERRGEAPGRQPLFSYGSSGPFGDDTPGEWCSLDEAALAWLAFRRLGEFAYGPMARQQWFDLHATWKAGGPRKAIGRVRSGALVSE